MTWVQLAERDATVLWSGDVVVLGGGLAGVAAAMAAAERRLRVCMVEPGPTLGTEVSAAWVDTPPAGRLAASLAELCGKQGASRGPQVDPFVATLAFDRLVEAAGIHALVRLMPVRPVTDARGRLAGVEVVGKSGRQVVLAPIVVDATSGRSFSRRVLGLQPLSVAAAERRLYVHGVQVPAGGAEIAAGDIPGSLWAVRRIRITPAVWAGEALVAFETGFVPAATSLGHALAETLAAGTGLMAWLRSTQPAFAKAILVDVSPGVLPVWGEAGPRLSLPARTGLLPLPLGRDLAEELRRTAAGLSRYRWGADRRVRLPSGAGQGDAPTLSSCELSAAVEQDLASVRLAPASAQLHEPRQVLVAGYGTAGAFAAMAAAEAGAQVTVLDPAPFPGGIATAGNIHSYYHGTPGGLQDRLDEGVSGLTHQIGPASWGFHPTAKADILLRGLRHPNVQVYTGHTVFGVVRRGTAVEGLVSAAETGYHVFPCTVAVDATGDGDVAAAAGAGTSLGRVGDGFPQPYSYTPSFTKDGRRAHRNFDAGWCDPTDSCDYSRAHFEGRHRLWAQGPFSDQRHYCTLAPLLGIRESRFIRGRLGLTYEDFLNGCTYPDTVCDGLAHYDNHALDYAEESEWARRHVVMFGLWRELCSGWVPYRALLPEGVDGLLVGCRALAVDHDLHQLLRMQRDMQKLGEICGLAAALAVERGVAPAELDTELLRSRLAERGILPRKPATPALDLSTDELLAALGTDKNGLAMWRLSRLPQERRPNWSQVISQELDQNRRFCAAVAASLNAWPQPEARSVLLQAVAERWSDPRLGVKSPPRFVIAALALAQVRDPDAGQLLAGILTDANLDPPTLLLVLLGLEMAADPTTVQVVQGFLDRSRNEEFRVALWGCEPGWTTSFRFAVVLRAVRVLQALGCRDVHGWLTPYLTHENLLVRKYARRLAAVGAGGR